ncbi:inhibitor of growth protein 1 isoform X2 [Ctenocephalides felis]|uniref:inhibitor of growth protein 1 isoform X2 n=1 Tax=Ctenocephalides felis TaxID=7515 RepID=UPI000E6E3996|nr:inhibitor of growth protein 1 isoform X2 [Ctenocephalides felis]
MNMINPVTNQEAVYSATYVDNYLDCVENLPDDLQRYLSRVRELDISYRACIREVENNYETLNNINMSPDHAVFVNRKSKVINRIQQSLICAQELGDEKLQIVQQLQDLIDNKSRLLDQNYKSLDYNKDEPVIEPLKEVSITPNPATPTLPLLTNVTCSTSASCTVSSLQHQNSGERASKRARRTKNETQEISSSENSVSVEQSPAKQVSTNICANTSTNKKGGGKKKKRKARNVQQTIQRERSNTPPPEEPDTIDPDEPTYCLCDQISFGEMILCDNDLCPIEWFHFSCVALSTKPKGKWYCPKCRGDRPNVMKPKSQFLKELERYNKQREEKS